MIPVRSASLVPAILERSSAAIAGRSLMVHTAPHAQERDNAYLLRTARRRIFITHLRGTLVYVR